MGPEEGGGEGGTAVDFADVVQGCCLGGGAAPADPHTEPLILLLLPYPAASLTTSLRLRPARPPRRLHGLFPV